MSPQIFPCHLGGHCPSSQTEPGWLEVLPVQLLVSLTRGPAGVSSTDAV